jgi:ribonuclease PH
MRVDGRQSDELRPVTITPDYLKTADGSCLIEFGDTKVICTATVENRAPFHRRDSGSGWVTAEYAMLPRSSNVRIRRDIANGKISGRGSEIQRLIGRSLRAIFDMDKFGERTMIIDCDVIQADGGTRTASISGGLVAMGLAMKKLIAERQASKMLIRDSLAAVSVGIVEGRPVLDLCYLEDAQADVDMNVVMTGDGRLIEVQGTAEGSPFSRGQLAEMLDLADKGIKEIVAAQLAALGIDSFTED